MISKPFKLQSYGISDIGLVRENNEDVWTQLPHIQFFALADGMGGHNAGEVAARVTIANLSQFIEKQLACQERPSIETLSMLLKKGIAQVNGWVHELADQHQQYSGMGTTLCCFLLFNNSLIYAHVGDSRIYRFRTHLERLTIDHSLRHELITQGKLDQKKAASFSYKNVITRAIGLHPTVEPEIGITHVSSEDIYFLCSDGLTDHVDDDEIASFIQSTTPLNEICQTLVNRAKIKGGNDNITILMVKVSK